MPTTSNEDQPSPSSSPSSKLLKLVAHELNYVEESFEAAKRAMNRVLVDMKEARSKFNDLVIMQQQVEATTRGGGGGGGGGGTETDENLYFYLQELRKQVSNFESSIPLNLIANYSDYEQFNQPNMYRRRPPNAPTRRHLVGTPPIPRFEHLNNLGWFEKSALSFLVAFPEGTIIKKSILVGLIENINMSSLDLAQELVDKWVLAGLVTPVHKKANYLAVDGYRVNPLARFTIKNALVSRYAEDFVYIPRKHPEEEVEEDIIYSDPFPFSDNPKWEVLHLGKWNKSVTYDAEVEDLDPFFKSVCALRSLKYLSLRGISMIKELPKRITQLDSLRTLDLNTCYHLEVIPSEIANLRHTLTYLDMSECYSLEHMPIGLAQLNKLRVLKGFFIGPTHKKDQCSLKDLVASLTELVKLKISTNVGGFPNENDIATLHEFKALRNLTISWEGCSILTSNVATVTNRLRFDFELEKLDLQCVPSMVVRSWLKPDSFKTLKRLYIRGGRLHDLGQRVQDGASEEDDRWSVEVLRLKYLRELKMDWQELEILFPRLVYLEKVQCPQLASFLTDDNGVWRKLD